MARGDKGYRMLIKVKQEFMYHQNGNVHLCTRVSGLEGPFGLADKIHLGLVERFGARSPSSRQGTRESGKDAEVSIASITETPGEVEDS